MGWLTGWSGRFSIDSQNAKVAEALEQGYYKLDNAPAEFHSDVKDGGGDIRVTKADGTTEVAREVVFYNAATDAGELHFNTTGMLTGANVRWYIYYGNAGANDYPIDAEFGAENVWGANDKCVLHLKDETTSSVLDSTGNDSDGVKGAVNSPLEAVGRIGKGQDYEYSDNDDRIAVTPNGFLKNKGTVLCLTKFESFPDGILWDSRGAGASGYLIFQVLSSRNLFFGCDGEWNLLQDPGTVDADTWYMLAATWDFDADEYAILINGIVVDSSTSSLSAPGSLGATTMLGARYATDSGSWYTLDGILDEVRFSDIARSSNWLLTTSNNLLDPATFWATGSAEGQPTVDTFTATPNEITAGDSSMLAWTTTDAGTSVAIDQGVGAVAEDGSVSVSPTATTTYTITATGPGGVDTDTVTVTVNPAPEPEPEEAGIPVADSMRRILGRYRRPRR